VRIGVDVGGTNTDAALMDGKSIVAATKVPTTDDIGGGVVAAIRDLMSKAEVKADSIDQVMIGTTQFTNAFVQRKNLQQVGIVRLALPATASIPPLTGWPDELAQSMGDNIFLAKGGYEYNGAKISELDESEIRSIAGQIGDRGIGAVSVSCSFSTVCSDMENRAAEILCSELPDVAITKSHDIGSTGLLARENAAVINCSLRTLADKVVQSFAKALDSLGIQAPLYISQNDGTLMTADFAQRFPVLTFASGPTNSMRGAALLTGCDDAIVVDIGGTTADLGVLQQGFPRQSAGMMQVGGVHTNFRMPDILSIGLGGGSIVENNGKLTIGPVSVGYELTQKALVFGGYTLTTTDIAVAHGGVDIGDRSKVSHLDSAFVNECNSLIHKKLSDAVDRMKTSAEGQTVILVGGGSCLVNETLSGASEQITPEHSGVANAIGAGIAQIGGEVDRVFSYEQLGREGALEQAREEATASAVNAGALADSVSIVDIEEVPLAYMPGGSVRVRVKAVGDLAEN